MADIFTAGFTLDDRLKAITSDDGTTYGVGMMVGDMLMSLEVAMLAPERPDRLTAYAARRVAGGKAVSTMHVTPELAADEALVDFLRRGLDEQLAEFVAREG